MAAPLAAHLQWVSCVKPPCRAWCRYDTPLVADIHFQPAVALAVADAFEKIRINPGNFVDGRKTFEEINYDDESQFRAEQEHIREVAAFPPSCCTRSPSAWGSTNCMLMCPTACDVWFLQCLVSAQQLIKPVW